MPKKQAGENTKKAAGNAKKAEVAAQKAAAEGQKKAAAEDADWSKGSKSNAKKEDAEAKKAEAARKKAEKDALLAEEERSLATARAAPKNAKSATKKTNNAPVSKGLDLAQLDDDEGTSSKHAALHASGIDNALDALALTSGTSANDKVDRHPERRYKAAYAAYEARRMPEIEEEFKGLRKQQRVDVCRKEFERSPENPFNQVTAKYDSTKDELKSLKEKEREKVEARLAAK